MSLTSTKLLVRYWGRQLNRRHLRAPPRSCFIIPLDRLLVGCDCWRREADFVADVRVEPRLHDRPYRGEEGGQVESNDCTQTAGVMSLAGIDSILDIGIEQPRLKPGHVEQHRGPALGPASGHRAHHLLHTKGDVLRVLFPPVCVWPPVACRDCGNGQPVRRAHWPPPLVSRCPPRALPSCTGRIPRAQRAWPVLLPPRIVNPEDARGLLNVPVVHAEEAREVLTSDGLSAKLFTCGCGAQLRELGEPRSLDASSNGAPGNRTRARGYPRCEQYGQAAPEDPQGRRSGRHHHSLCSN
mmetsp:Transcript_21580/g.54772  ORF Transcript_21580/g.54772 Transcript_21580/m.54772 type:complete len:297 (+) Transcript_21580:102-992(+)